MTGYEYDPMIWPTLGSAGFTGAVALYIWHRREIKGALALALAGFVMSLWCIGAAAELSAPDVATQRLWFMARDALALPGAIFAFWFALQYAGLERWLTRPVTSFLVIVLVVHTSLFFVDDGQLLWSRLWLDGEIRGERGPVGAAFNALVLGFFLVGTAVFLFLFARSPAHRVPVALILLGHVGLRIVYVLGVFKIAYVPNIPSAVVAFDFVSLMYAIALFRFRLFDLLPVARQAILERMPDALLVLDAHDRIADLNDTAVRFLQLPRTQALGEPVATVLADFPDLAARITQPATPSAEARFETANGTRTCEVNSTPLTDWQARPIGRLVVLHDTSELRRLEEQLVERERALAAAQERERMARELHDGLAQDLWLAKLKTGRLASLPDLGVEARALTGEVSEAVDAGLVEARQAVAAMRLSAGGDGSLRELLSRTLEDFEDRFGLRIEFDCDEELPTLSPRADAETLRIVQEALTNVRRHADATVVRVRAGIDDGRLSVVVADNGCGFDPELVGDGAYGLASMRERAALVGGDLQVDSAPQNGTRVRILVPAPVSAPVGAGAS